MHQRQPPGSCAAIIGQAWDSDLEKGQDVWVSQAVLIAAQHVGHLAEALLPNAELPQTEGNVPPLLAVLHQPDRHTVKHQVLQ